MTEQGTPPPSSKPQCKRDRPLSPQASDVGPSGRLWARPPTDAPPGRGRRPVPTTRVIQRWGLWAVALLLLGFLIYNLVGGGSGAAAVGATVTDRTGVGLTVSAPQQDASADVPPVTAGEQIYQVIVAVNNPTDAVLSSSDVSITAMVNGAAAEAVYPQGRIVQKIESNMQLNIPFWFKVKDGTTGDLLITVQKGVEEPTYFKGSL